MIELASFKELTIASTRCQDVYVDDNACVVPLENGAAETEYAGVPLTPTIWLINFMFLYKLNPKVAANMPGYAAKLPGSVAKGMIEAQGNDAFGLPYQDTINLLPGVTTLNQTSKQKTAQITRAMPSSALPIQPKLDPASEKPQIQAL